MKAEIYKENYFALYLAIINNMTGLQALKAMRLTEERRKVKRSTPRKYFLSDEDYEEIIRLKREGLMWKEIGEKYNIPERIMAQLVRKYMGEGWKNRGW